MPSFFRPTPEEIKKWSTDFDALLSHEYGLLIFHDFLKSQHSQENLNFWIAVERYKLTPNEAAREIEAKLIYENYISIMSPTEVRKWRKVCYIKTTARVKTGLVK